MQVYIHEYTNRTIFSYGRKHLLVYFNIYLTMVVLLLLERLWVVEDIPSARRCVAMQIIFVIVPKSTIKSEVTAPTQQCSGNFSAAEDHSGNRKSMKTPDAVSFRFSYR